MQLRSALLACALVGATGLATHAEEADRFRLAGWEVEQAIPRPSLGEVGPLKPADFGLDAFPVSPLVAEANNPDDEAPETVQAPPVPQPTEADFAAMPDDPPSLVEAGQPDPAITAERVAQQLRVLLARPGGDRALQQGFNPFYAGRAYQPLFVKDGIISERGQQVLNRLPGPARTGSTPPPIASSCRRASATPRASPASNWRSPRPWRVMPPTPPAAAPTPSASRAISTWRRRASRPAPR